MKTASMVLGIVGGVIAFLFAMVFIFGGALFSSLDAKLFDSINRYAEENSFDNSDIDEDTQDMQFIAEGGSKIAGLVFTFLGIFSALGAVLAFIGGLLVKKHRVMSGIFMLVGAFTGFFTCYGTIASIMLIIAGIFALIPDRAVPPPYPPQPQVTQPPID